MLRPPSTWNGDCFGPLATLGVLASVSDTTEAKWIGERWLKKNKHR
jgi:hypothetical protein